MKSESVTVSQEYQITIPKTARQLLGIKPGDELMFSLADGMMVLLPRPDDFVQYMAGLHQEIWQGIDTTAYLKGERGLTLEQE
ncbi:Transcriptional regulator, AbrB family [Candidatus Promineifilum breve]|uniref:Transcriptional regulator, AbrB family n=1 Tax=Candidatus Promineifilum breve TaxID=1806508 RepID=A0A160T1W0_9CHLR|nr:AbrB/MazE/SpoVT family DNA-binding domain-containing protein [Candidatus Promineifilum breve]CUS03502.2 Transcriptional regulator, AbrB family [Candidatus Promineifilum breve]